METVTSIYMSFGLIHVVERFMKLSFSHNCNWLGIVTLGNIAQLTYNQDDCSGLVWSDQSLVGPSDRTIFISSQICPIN